MFYPVRRTVAESTECLLRTEDAKIRGCGYGARALTILKIAKARPIELKQPIGGNLPVRNGLGLAGGADPMSFGHFPLVFLLRLVTYNTERYYVHRSSLSALPYAQSIRITQGTNMRSV